jgi:hypothetical protein
LKDRKEATEESRSIVGVLRAVLVKLSKPVREKRGFKEIKKIEIGDPVRPSKYSCRARSRPATNATSASSLRRQRQQWAGGDEIVFDRVLGDSAH